jgi:hypothetical protein
MPNVFLHVQNQKPWIPGDPFSGNLFKTAASGKKEFGDTGGNLPKPSIQKHPLKT